MGWNMDRPPHPSLPESAPPWPPPPFQERAPPSRPPWDNPSLGAWNPAIFSSLLCHPLLWGSSCQHPCVLELCLEYILPLPSALMLVSHFSAPLTVNFLKKWSPHRHTAPGPASCSSSNPPGSWLHLTAELAQVRAARSCHAAQSQAALSGAHAVLLETLLHPPSDAAALLPPPSQATPPPPKQWALQAPECSFLPTLSPS